MIDFSSLALPKLRSYRNSNKNVIIIIFLISIITITTIIICYSRRRSCRWSFSAEHPWSRASPAVVVARWRGFVLAASSAAEAGPPGRAPLCSPCQLLHCFQSWHWRLLQAHLVLWAASWWETSPPPARRTFRICCGTHWSLLAPPSPPSSHPSPTAASK